MTSKSEYPIAYRAIADYLVRQAVPSVLLTYEEIEAMVGERLPLGAVLSTTWWTNGSLLHVRMWREHGWRAAAYREHRRVRFTRDTGA